MAHQPHRPGRYEPRPGSQVHPQGKRYWFPYEEQRLLAMKRDNRTWPEIAKSLKRSAGACKHKWEEIRPATMIPRPPPLVLSDKDETYVGLCLAEGGFHGWSEKQIGVTSKGERKMVVCLPITRPGRGA